jgi:hypothetical protein
VLLNDGTKVYWNGTAWAAGEAPANWNGYKNMEWDALETSYNWNKMKGS